MINIAKLTTEAATVIREITPGTTTAIEHCEKSIGELLSSNASNAVSAYVAPVLKKSTVIEQQAEKLFGKQVVESARKCNNEFVNTGTFQIQHGSSTTPVKLFKKVMVTGIDKYPSVEFFYEVRNMEGEVAGSWNGIVCEHAGKTRFHGGQLHVKEYGKDIKGIGTFIKEQVKEDARLSGQNAIDISANYHSHVFHYKTGYRSKIETPISARLTVKEIKRNIEEKETSEIAKSFLPEIDRILQLPKNSPEYVIEANKLIDLMLSKAAQNNLRTPNIGLGGVGLPMICKF